MYFYSIYGLKAISNIKIPFLNEIDSESQFNIQPVIRLYIRITPTYIYNSAPFIEYCEEICKIHFKHAKYILNLKNNSIYSESDSLSNVFLSLFNIPYSIMLSNNGYILLHSSSCVYNNKLVVFVGKKGAGKSTILLKSAMQGSRFYSDDTLMIDSTVTTIYAYKAPGGFKYTKDCFECFKDFIHLKSEQLSFNPTSNKYIVQYKKELTIEEQQNLSSVFVISRHSQNSITLTEIESMIAKKALVINNIVGIKYYSNPLLEKLVIAPTLNYLVRNVKIFELHLPNDLNYQYDLDAILNKAGL